MAAVAGVPGLVPIADPIHGHVYDTKEQEIRQRNWGLTARVDPSVTFEEYQYWAKIERADEMERNRTYIEQRGPRTFGSVIKGRFSKGIHYDNAKKMEQEMTVATASNDPDSVAPASSDPDSKGGVVAGGQPPQYENSMRVTDEEWKQAARALKTASWGTIFFLITTDILGWSTTP